MRYLFLDIDGPLNTGRNDFLDPDRYGHHFDDAAVRNLRRIVKETGAKIVVSSSWRHMGLERIRDIWERWGLPGDIVGCTPGAWGSNRVFSSRGEEIRQWLTENAETDDVYVILDDMSDQEALDELKTCWIRISPHTGISLEDATKAITILMR